MVGLPGPRYEIERAPDGASWGVMDLHRDEWAERPPLGEAFARRKCGELNEAWERNPEDCANAIAIVRPSAQLSIIPDDPTGMSAGEGRARPGEAAANLRDELVVGLLENFTDKGGEAIEAVRSEKPLEYLKLIASFVPRLPDAPAREPITEIRRIIVPPPRY